jgi:hypothetical protein
MLILGRPTFNPGGVKIKRQLAFSQGEAPIEENEVEIQIPFIFRKFLLWNRKL